jgi:hypothetical protein
MGVAELSRATELPRVSPHDDNYIFGSTLGSFVLLFTMKLDARDLRYVSTDEFKVLSAVCLFRFGGIDPDSAGGDWVA